MSNLNVKAFQGFWRVAASHACRMDIPSTLEMIHPEDIMAATAVEQIQIHIMHASESMAAA